MLNLNQNSQYQTANQLINFLSNGCINFLPESVFQESIEYLRVEDIVFSHLETLGLTFTREIYRMTRKQLSNIMNTHTSYKGYLNSI